jgi:hypothetical protein
VFESSRYGFKCSHGRGYMPGDFTSLARSTLSRPVTTIFVYRWPNKTRRNQVLRRAYPRMGELNTCSELNTLRRKGFGTNGRIMSPDTSQYSATSLSGKRIFLRRNALVPELTMSRKSVLRGSESLVIE